MYAIPMKSKSKVMQDVKGFTKDIGAPDSIICDAASDQKSKSLRKFLVKIGTKLRVLCKRYPMGKQGKAIYWIDKIGGAKRYEGL